ncbi:SRPBCC family protein [Oscillatoria sp. CS-180]|uniref:SRPBCC family protein n=1 Tax=Oscillatoria sp. CS-180 TaxID=3021720 RepID=UPI00232DDEE8|nr:SRPBCC family protein [Oscillatoria sp. CS-180]MDB9525554.1 SRPBCC family protein [Oscillatoria sp. CS-180]
MTDASCELNTPADQPLAKAKGDDCSLEISAEKLQGRQRRILASILIPCPIEQVWQILTDYDNLADFIPNLTVSRRLESTESMTLLEQIGSQCFLNIQFCARVVLKMAEQFPNRIGFTMIEGDFKAFEGAWRLEPEQALESRTRLTYEVTVCPPRTIPAILIERHLRNDLTQNLRAIRQYAIASAGVA